MLPKISRLTKREDFKIVFTKGKFVGIPEGIAIKFLKNDLNCTRLGFPIGKNFSKKAVERNRAKRILRASSFPYLQDLKPGFDIIVLMRPDFKNVSHKNIFPLFEKVFKKADLINQ